MKKAMIFGFGLMLSMISLAQEKYMTRTGTVYFKSNAEIEDGVEATNKSAACVLNTDNGEIVFQVAMKAFRFEKALMEEHYNENYLETTQFPKSSLRGSIVNYSKDLLDGKAHEITIEGEFNLHGVTKMISEKGTIQMIDRQIVLKSHFLVPLEDYKIAIPKMVQDKIAKDIDVDLDMILDKV